VTETARVIRPTTPEMSLLSIALKEPLYLNIFENNRKRLDFAGLSQRKYTLALSKKREWDQTILTPEV
jgi:hypothetical protein